MPLPRSRRRTSEAATLACTVTSSVSVDFEIGYHSTLRVFLPPTPMPSKSGSTSRISST